MEGFIGIGIIIAVFVIIKAIASANGGGGGGGGTTGRQMGVWEVRRQFGAVENIKTIKMEARGVLPLAYPASLGFETSVFDVTNGETKPVICFIEDMQEADSIVYRHAIRVPDRAYPDTGYQDWTSIGVVPIEFLVPPQGGMRELSIVTRLVDLNNPPSIQHGYAEPNKGKIFATHSVDLTYDFGTNKGYEENATERDEAMALSLKIAVAVAMSDGEWSDSEGEHLHSWMLKTISAYSGEREQSLKDVLNDALEEAHSKSLARELDLVELTARMNEIGERSEKFETIELAIDVMAADGVASGEEIDMIRSVSASMGLDYDEVASLSDQRLIDITSFSEDIDAESLVGIDRNWTVEQKRSHLTQEYVKWSNRTSSLSDPLELDNARKMLETIAELRQQYEE